VNGGSEVTLTIQANAITNSNTDCPIETRVEFKTSWDEWTVVRTQGNMIAVDTESADKTVTITVDQKQFLNEDIWYTYGNRQLDDSKIKIEGRFITTSVVTGTEAVDEFSFTVLGSLETESDLCDFTSLTMTAGYGLEGERLYTVDEVAPERSVLAFADISIEGLEDLKLNQPGCFEQISTNIEY
jgi:hypothetical protein